MPSIFLSHSHKDKPFARILSENLQANGIRVWIDEAEMQIGDSLLSKIEKAIQDFTYVGVVLSPSSVASEWVRKEVEIALMQEIRGKRVKVLPILYQECDIPSFLATKIYADLSTDFEEGFIILLKRLLSDLQEDSHKQKRAYEVLQISYQDWISYGRNDRQLLPTNTIYLILEHITEARLSVDLLEYLLCSVCYERNFEQKNVNSIRYQLEHCEFEAISDLFTRLFKHPTPHVRVHAARLVSRLNERRVADLLLNILTTETNDDMTRACMQSLYKLHIHLPIDLATTLFQTKLDWEIRTYALTSLPGVRSCLLVSDGTSFASELGALIKYRIYSR